MMLGSGLVHLVAAALVPAALLLSVAPQLFLLWLIWRILTIALPDSLYQKGDDFIFSLYQRIIIFFFEHVTGAQVALYGDVNPILNTKERVLYLSNHQSDADWVVVHMLAARQGMVGQVRYILKNSIQLVPLFGHALYQHGCIYVNRRHFSQDKMVKALRYLRNLDIPSWIVLFPEGTRFNLAIDKQNNLLEANRQKSRDLGLRPLNHLLFPRLRGMSLTLGELRDNFDAVYDVTIIYEGTKDSETQLRKSTPSMFQFLRLCRPKLHVHINRIEMQKVPRSEEKLQNWLYDLFVRKDRLLDEYYGANVLQRGGPATRGPFACPVPSILSKWETVPAVVFCIAIWIPAFFYATYLVFYWRILVFGSLGCYVWLGIGSIS